MPQTATSGIVRFYHKKLMVSSIPSNVVWLILHIHIYSASMSHQFMEWFHLNSIWKNVKSFLFLSLHVVFKLIIAEFKLAPQLLPIGTNGPCLVTPGEENPSFPDQPLPSGSCEGSGRAPTPGRRCRCRRAATLTWWAGKTGGGTREVRLDYPAPCPSLSENKIRKHLHKQEA